ncbi:MAG: hypothetical protein LBG76_01645, partial [Treponema sp.]|nr:hypothetical protein [Treponema sp.]
MVKQTILLFLLGALLCAPLCAQTHVSVPLESEVYYILEQAEARGLCGALSGVKPYPRSVVIAAIREILASDG